MRITAPLIALSLVSCDGADDSQARERATRLKQDRLKFQEELTILTYHSQCPAAHPSMLEPLAAEIDALKSNLERRILASPLKPELVASLKEMDRQSRYSYESDCIGTPFPDDDQESVADYRSRFASEKQKLRSLDLRFRGLAQRVVD